MPLTLVCEEAHRYVPADGPARLRALQTRDRQDRQGRPQVRRRALHRLAAAGRDRPDHPLPVQHRLRAAHVERPRPGDRERPPSPTPARACWSSCPRSDSARRSPSATAWRCPCASSSTSFPPTACRASSTARFTEHWQKSVGDEGFLEQVVEKWRSSDIGAGSDATQHAAMMADGLGIDPGPLAPEPLRPPAPAPRQESPLAARVREADVLRPSAPAPQPAAPANPAARPTPTVRRDTFGSAPASPPPQRAGTAEAAGSEQQSRCPAPRSSRCATALCSASSARNRQVERIG